MNPLVRIWARFLSKMPRGCKICEEFKRKVDKNERKQTKNRRQLRVDQCTYYSAAVRVINQAITF